MDNTINYKLKKPTPEDWYNIQDHNDNMDIVDAELKKLNDGKAPSGHGLGGITVPTGDTSFMDSSERGNGFYQIKSSVDSPLSYAEWLSLLQLMRINDKGNESGVQMSFYDFLTSTPRMWLRTLLNGEPGKWVEMLHTGNISQYANTRIATGTYVGAGSKTKTLTGIPFKADMIFIFEGNDTDPVAKYKMVIINGVSKTIPLWGDGDQRCDVTWDGNVPTWSSGAANATSANANAMNYNANKYYWFAFGKGEGN